jgi:fluoroquinolone transport system permease protein
LSSALLCLAGFLAVTRYTSINAFLFPSVLIVFLVELPLFDYFGLVDTPLVYLHPLQAPLTLMRAAFEPVSTGELIYGCVVSLLSLDLLLHLSQRALRRFVTQQPGEERAQ